MAWRRRIDTLRTSLEASSPTPAARTDLPSEIVGLAERSGASPASGSRIVKLSQRGKMWQRSKGAPLAFTANQVITVGDIGFLWDARFSLMGIPSLQVIDYLVGREGGLEGRMFGVLPLVNVAATDETFRGEAMRYLGELMWNPDAILFNSHLQWRVANSRTLSVVAGDGPRRSEIRLLLDQSGDAVRFEADDRPRLEGSAFTRSAWFGRCWDYRTIRGRRIPLGAEAGWIVQGKEFIYWRGIIENWHAEH
jgi:hypothetical protein